MSVKVGIVGATGAVGEELVHVLSQRKFPVSSLTLFASERSAGNTVDASSFGKLTVQLFSVEKAKTLDIVFLAASGSFAKKFAKAIAEDGAVVIDNSSALRYDDDVPLIIPEINPHALGQNNVIANPNCTTAVAILPLYALHKQFGLKKIIVSTYQAASGAGTEGMKELEKGTGDYLKDPKSADYCKVFQHPLRFNVIPHIDSFQENGYTREEMKVTWETRKILELKDLAISCTAVRIPTFRTHSEAVSVELEKPVDCEVAKERIAAMDGVKLVDDPAKNSYPMPLTSTYEYDVEVGRIRKNLVFENGIDFFVCGDQLLRGAALNAVLIGELVVKERFSNKKRKLNGN